MNGFVSFVSSGNRDPDLLTLKAVARIAAATDIRERHVSEALALIVHGLSVDQA